MGRRGLKGVDSAKMCMSCQSVECDGVWEHVGECLDRNPGEEEGIRAFLNPGLVPGCF